MRINRLSIYYKYMRRGSFSETVSCTRDKTFNRARETCGREADDFFTVYLGSQAGPYFIYYQTTRNERSEVSFIGLNVGKLPFYFAISADRQQLYGFSGIPSLDIN